MSRLPRLRWAFAASLYGRSHGCPSPSLLSEKFLKIIPHQHSLRKRVFIWTMTRQSPVVPAKLKYSMIIWFLLLLLYHFFVIFCVLNSPSLLSLHLRWPSNDLQSNLPSWSLWTMPQPCHMPVTLISSSTHTPLPDATSQLHWSYTHIQSMQICPDYIPWIQRSYFQI